jgi:hypothetical protein
MSSDFDAFLARAWAEHTDHPEAVADRLRSDTPAPRTPEQLAALVRFAVHLLGEHLGRFDDARWRLAALASHRQADASVQSALRVATATLALGEGKLARMTDFSTAEKVRAEAAAAALCVGRRKSVRALELIASARGRLTALPASTAADHRPLAVACNNMAWELCDRGAARTDAETAAMLDIAAASRVHWARAGTWVEIERADYCLALTHLSAGLADQALAHAARCLAACVSHDAPAYEHFYAHEAMARVQHARHDPAACAQHVQAALAAFDRLGADDQSACAAPRAAVIKLAPVAA